jgi:hypothetical protein
MNAGTRCRHQVGTSGGSDDMEMSGSPIGRLRDLCQSKRR